MSRSTSPEVFVSRAAVQRLLAGKPRRYQLVCRASAVQRLAEDCARFFPWPALHASLMNDARALRDAMDRGHWQ